ncbi:MAG TPA: hypothetical protein VFQ36_09600, partial [Ktedonobacteraceae bacterium]|nr:hypothetical protein [Ktedonobacteraceae bacterium]
MTRRSLATSSLLEAKQKKPGKSVLNTPRPQRPPNRLWPWLIILLVTGVILLSVVSVVTWNWLHSLPITLDSSLAHTQTTTFKVNRTVSYADLSLNVVNAQYSTSFSDDLIHSGPAFARLNMQVTNKMNFPISLVYYDIARLLVPKQEPIAPTNVQLASNVLPGATVKGWIDFPVAIGTQLANLKLQLGSVVLNETLVVVPFTGAFHPEQYLNHLYPQTLTIYYTFKGYTLVYHLTSVDVRYSYNGVQVRAGQQYYVLNLSVDNTNGADVSPGLGFDYIRLIVNGADRPPNANTL